MIKLVWRIVLLVLVGLAFTWIADRPGEVTIQWLGYDIRLKMLAAVALFAVMLAAFWLSWKLFSKLWTSPRHAREYWRFRKHKKAYESLSRGLIAASAGDSQAATRHATHATATLKNEPLLNVLSAQAAQLRGDRTAVQLAFEAMTKNPETEVLGLRGLFAEARQAGDLSAAIRHAERALALNPRLAWASTAMLQIQSARKDWQAAAATIASQGKSGLLPRPEADRKQAALLAAEALNIEDTNRDRALTLAQEALKLDPALVPAALVAARRHIAANSTRKAVRTLREIWERAPHPDIAETLAHARPGDGPEERFERVRDLVGSQSHTEAAVALARAGIAAQRWDVARKALAPFMDAAPQARMCALMAQIEEAGDDRGRAREWLARALNAPRDPMWVSDGVACPRWTPVSPVTGEIVPCEWKVPFEMPAQADYAPLLTPAPREPAASAAIAGPPAAVTTLSASVAPPMPDDPGVAKAEIDR